MRVPTLVKTAAAVTATAAAGAAATSTGTSSRWYRRLRKPAWQPPSAAFPLVWTPLYGPERAAFARGYALNLALNAGWTALFFGARRPGAALAEIAALNASNLVLLRRAARTDRPAGAALAPYVAWTLFATALNGAIVGLNRGR
ncbi:TspO/MBR family protein [Micromonospora aurantiaca]|uniref:TspO/MBR family protein n=1 Tax=Micromonospora aurantiaca (nom. illeg.) TaxID=47850 RepID=UPI0008293654|nr:TspO/MBR family protein [Micromonospora aurantiaca]RNI04218.1 tryptophan-rich sensory protein [Micromonospora aurantiaca]SCL37745.1 TspO and MBR related proteins [Micromonospora aurantiaca]